MTVQRRTAPPRTSPKKRGQKRNPRVAAAEAAKAVAAAEAAAAAKAKGPRRLRTTFCDETCTTIIGWLSAGNFRESAAARAKVSPSTLGDWLKRGEQELEKTVDGEELGPYAQFYVDVISAEATAETTMVGMITEGDNEDRRWFLERRYPRRFGRMATRVELTGEGGKPIEVKDARQTLLGRLLAVVGAGAAQADDPEPDPG